MRSGAIALVVLLLTAGCIGVGGSTEDVSSLEDQARDRAEERVEDPQLVGAFAIEPPRHDEREGNEFWTYLDDEAGDGRAPGWVYIFEGVDRVGAVAVAAEVGILAEAWTTEEDALDAMEPLGDWEVTSSAAAEALADHEDWPELNETHVVFWALEKGEEGPVWEVSVERALGDWEDEVHALVDASTGDVLSVEQRPHAEYGPGEPPSPPGTCDVQRAEGLVTPTGPSVYAHAFLPDDGTVVVEVEHSGAGVLEVEVVRDGEVVWDTTEVSQPGGAGFSQAWDDAEEGTYEVRARTPAGAVDVSLTLAVMTGDCDEAHVSAEHGLETWSWQVLRSHFLSTA